MRSTTKWILAGLLAAHAGTAPADTGHDLVQQCEQALRLNALGIEGVDTDTVVEGVYCVGYVGGVIDGLKLAEDLRQAPSGARSILCLPSSGLDLAQAVRLLLEWADEHPDDLDEPAPVVVHRALAGTFRCDIEKARPKRKK